jgi:hypothetical protein
MNRSSWWQDETDSKVEQLRRDYRREQRRASVVQWAIIIGTAVAAVGVVLGFALS